jgi:hypothetical protein
MARRKLKNKKDDEVWYFALHSNCSGQKVRVTSALRVYFLLLIQESQTQGLPVHFTLSAVMLSQLWNVALLGVQHAFSFKCFITWLKAQKCLLALDD